MSGEAIQRRHGVSARTVLLLAVLAFLGGAVSTASFGQDTQEAGTSFTNALLPVFCYLPAALLAIVALIAVAAGSYYGKQRWDAKARIWQARAKSEETAVERQRVQLGDLTPGPDGQEVARIVQAEDGRVMLVTSGKTTSPVTLVDADAAVRPDQVPDEHTLMALIADALARAAQSGGGAPRAGGEWANLALFKALGMGAQPQDRLPPTVRVLPIEDVQLLDSGREE